MDHHSCLTVIISDLVPRSAVAEVDLSMGIYIVPVVLLVLLVIFLVVARRGSKLLPVAKVAAECSAEEQRRFREQFAPIAQRYRRRNRRFKICTVVGALWMGIPAYVFVATLFGLPSSSASDLMERLFLIWIGGPLLCLVSVALLFALPELRCPACHNRLEYLDRRLPRYCPACGSSELEAGDWRRWPKCRACGKQLRQHKSRSYPIRACTHCGAILDDAGL